jgi:competence protein ComEC
MAMRDRKSTSGPPTRRASLSGLVCAVLLGTAVLLASCAPAPRPPGQNEAFGQAGDLASPPFDTLFAATAADELSGRLVIYFLDTGQSDASYIRAPDGKVLLIDTGDDDKTVVDFLKAKGVSRIDILVLSHPHADHTGGALAVLTEFDVGTLCHSGFAHTSEHYQRVLEKALSLQQAGELRVIEARTGQTLDAGEGVTVTILHPSEPLDPQANEASVVVRVAFGAFVALFAGDAGLETERAILARAGGQTSSLAATVLKVAHHGSSGASSAGFLAAVSPQAAVIEVGPNDYGHPHADTLDRLTAAGAGIFRTDLDGTIIVHSDGEGWGLLTGGN